MECLSHFFDNVQMVNNERSQKNKMFISRVYGLCGVKFAASSHRAETNNKSQLKNVL